MNNFYNQVTSFADSLTSENIKDLQSIADSLAQSLIGVDNLRSTYIGDINVEEQLRYICEHYITALYARIYKILLAAGQQPVIENETRIKLYTYGFQQDN